MFCPNCGKEMNEGAEFCSNCGERTQKNKILKNVKEYLKNKYFKGILIFIVILLVIFFIRNLIFNKSVDISNINKIKTVEEYTKNELKSINNLKTVSFGEYLINNENDISKIEWIVLTNDGHKALLLSKYILDVQPYHSDFADITWENCSLRKWLNSSFLSQLTGSSSQEEVKNKLNIILNTTLKNNNNSEYNIFGGNDTIDKVFILSNDEQRYYFKDDPNLCKATMTKYSNKLKTDYKNSYWIRTPGDSQKDVMWCAKDGYTWVNGSSATSNIGIRPAMWVDVSKIEIKKDIVANNNSVQTGWIGDCYYDNGTMIKNDWVEYNNNWYYLNDNGRYVKNDWKKIDNDYYYFDSSGVMKKNTWINNEYYVGNDGKMLVNTITPDGYYVDDSGKYVDFDEKLSDHYTLNFDWLDEITKNSSNANSTKNSGLDPELIKIYNETYAGIKINTCKFDKEGKLWVHDARSETSYHSNTAGYAEIYKIYTTKDNYIEYKLTYSDMRWGMYENDNYYKNNKKITETEFNNIRNTFENMQDMYETLLQNSSITINSSNDDLSRRIRNAKLVTEYSADTLVDNMDTVTFGSYPQSDASGNAKEPIEWIVLDRDENKHEALLLSKYVIDSKPYNEEGGSALWENCTLRKFLNNDLYNIAFNNEEKQKIINSKVINENFLNYDYTKKYNIKYNGKLDYFVAGGNVTHDKVFLLSESESIKYFSNWQLLERKDYTNGGTHIREINYNYMTKPTNFAKNKGIIQQILDGVNTTKDEWPLAYEIYKKYQDCCRFWSRSRCCVESCTWSMVVYENGMPSTGGNANKISNGIRPALWIRYE